MKPVSIARYSKYYDVTRNASPIGEYERNHEKITGMIELAGMFCLLSNAQDMSAEEACGSMAGGTWWRRPSRI